MMMDITTSAVSLKVKLFQIEGREISAISFGLFAMQDKVIPPPAPKTPEIASIHSLQRRTDEDLS